MRKAHERQRGFRAYFGTRFVHKLAPDGTEILEQVPMTLEDLLHPEESDQVQNCPLHDDERSYLKNVMCHCYPPDAGYRFTANWRIDWGVPGMLPHQPDIAGFQGVIRQPDPQLATFPVKASGGRCFLTVEMVFPESRKNEVIDKFHEYHQVGVPLYIIIDQEHEHGQRRLLPYRHTPSRYVEVPLDARGRVRLSPLNLDLALENGRLWLYDASSSERFDDYITLVRKRREQEEKLRELLAPKYGS